jgi:hypothetical protein
MALSAVPAEASVTDQGLMAYQSSGSPGSAYTYTLASGGIYLGLVDAFTSPSVTTNGSLGIGHCWGAAFQSNNNMLEVEAPCIGIGSAENPLGATVRPGTSPVITDTDHNRGSVDDYVVAFQGQDDDLHVITFNLNGIAVSNSNTGFQMAAGTSPAISSSGNNTYEVAFQSSSGDLGVYTYNQATGSGSGTVLGNLAMDAGTSPSIAADPDNTYEAAFETPSTHGYDLWTYYPGNNTYQTTTLGMKGGTSPSITADTSAANEWAIAFQDNGNGLYLYEQWAGIKDNLKYGMAAATSPALSYSSQQGLEIDFQANTGHLFYWNSTANADVDTGQPMNTGTSPSISG